MRHVTSNFEAKLSDKRALGQNIYLPLFKEIYTLYILAYLYTCTYVCTYMPVNMLTYLCECVKQWQKSATHFVWQQFAHTRTHPTS